VYNSVKYSAILMYFFFTKIILIYYCVFQILKTEP